ncbi:MAG: MFS transporter [Syntrophobacteraceae bacterium]|nr:MFS transporter [Desulfobacteraceae bacterium]
MTELEARGRTLKSWQTRIVAMGWMIYAAYYFGRVNLSVAIPQIREDMLLSAQQVGLMGSGFFLAYACGQLFSGYLGDRLSPRRLIFGGVLLSGLMNILFASTGVWELMLVAWTVNGVFQSTGWAPVIKLLSDWHRPEQRRTVAGIFATSYVAGNAVTWTLAGWLIVAMNWRAAFWVPALMMGACALVWLLLVRDRPEEVGFRELESAPSGHGGISSHRIPNVLDGLSRFWPLALAAVTGGFILYSLIIWLPSYFVEGLALGSGTAASLSAALPIAGIFGTMTVSWLIATRYAGREIRFAVGVYSCASALLALFPFVSSSVSGSLFLLILSGSILYGASTIITAIMPMLLSRNNETSTIAGFVDFAFNVGAGLAGVGIGALLDRYSWTAFFYALAGVGALTALLLLSFFFWEKRGKPAVKAAVAEPEPNR